MVWDSGGLCPKRWTRWTYFKEIQLYFFWQSFKQVSLFIITPIVLVLAVLVALPKSLYDHWRDK